MATQAAHTAVTRGGKFYRVGDLTSTAKKPGRYPVSSATWWRWVKEGRAPAPVKLGPGVTAWREDDLAAWEAQK